jgi:hypothetical protein
MALEACVWPIYETQLQRWNQKITHGPKGACNLDLEQDLARTQFHAKFPTCA